MCSEASWLSVLNVVIGISFVGGLNIEWKIEIMERLEVAESRILPNPIDAPVSRCISNALTIVTVTSIINFIKRKTASQIPHFSCQYPIVPNVCLNLLSK